MANNFIELPSPATVLSIAEPANTFLAGPTSGAPALPTFRPLVPSDIVGSSSVITSVAFASSGPSIYTVTGSPIIGSGTITIQENIQSSGLIFAGPSSGTQSVAPVFRAIVATDLPRINAGSTGPGGISGTLPVANGGSSSATFARNAVLLGNGQNVFLTVPPSSAGMVLTSDGNTWINSFIPSTGIGTNKWTNNIALAPSSGVYSNSAQFAGIFNCNGGSSAQVGLKGFSTGAKFNWGLLGIADGTHPTNTGAVNIGVAGMANPTDLANTVVGGWFKIKDSLVDSDFFPVVSGVVVAEGSVSSGATPLFIGYSAAAGEIRFQADQAGNLNIGGATGLGSIVSNNGTLSNFQSASFTGNVSANQITATQGISAYGSPCVVTRFSNDDTASTNASGSETILNQYNFVANSFTGNGNYLTIRASGKLVGDVTAKNVRVAFGGTDLVNYSVTNATDMFWVLEASVKQRSSGDQRYFGNFSTSTIAGASLAGRVISGSTTEDTTSDITIAAYGTGTIAVSGQVTNDILEVEQGFFVVPD